MLQPYIMQKIKNGELLITEMFKKGKSRVLRDDIEVLCFLLPPLTFEH